MRIRSLAWTAAAGGLLALAAAGPPDVTFQVDVLATGLDQPKGLDAPLHRAGAGSMGGFVYIAESGRNRVLTLAPDNTIGVACDTLGAFPVGLGCRGGSFGPYMFIGNAMGGGLERVDADGNNVVFALTGMGIAGLDFGRGHYGNLLDAGEWSSGDIWQVDDEGNSSLFATVPAGGESRYLKFSHGGSFGTWLYVTEFQTGDIYRFDRHGVATLFASTGAPGLEGLAFSPGGAFGDYLYAGNILTGDLFQIAPDGTVTTWMSGFPGVADLLFQPGGAGGFSLYMVDGVSAVYRIYKQ